MTEKEAARRATQLFLQIHTQLLDGWCEAHPEGAPGERDIDRIREDARALAVAVIRADWLERWR